MSDEDTQTLVWVPDPAAGVPDVFVDAQTDTEYRAGEHQISGEDSERFLSHPTGGWHESVASDTSATVDPAILVDQRWNSVKAAIDDGLVDQSLDELEELERDRDNGARSSVIDAINERRPERSDEEFEAALDETFDDIDHSDLEELDPFDRENWF